MAFKPEGSVNTFYNAYPNSSPKLGEVALGRRGLSILFIILLKLLPKLGEVAIKPEGSVNTFYNAYLNSSPKLGEVAFMPEGSVNTRLSKS